MKKKFKVTGLGLKIDGVMIMPGSELLLNAEPPSHWQRFGESLGSVSERKLEVASPAPEPQPEQVDQPKRRGRPRKEPEG